METLEQTNFRDRAEETHQHLPAAENRQKRGEGGRVDTSTVITRAQSAH
jgi:hypothetical protein